MSRKKRNPQVSKRVRTVRHKEAVQAAAVKTVEHGPRCPLSPVNAAKHGREIVHYACTCAYDENRDALLGKIDAERSL